MARVNLERRAEIGLAKRTRTRAIILQAARTCYAAETAAPVTVDSVMQAAGLAKGTFYVHFQDLAALDAELAGALIEELDESLQPARLAVDHPLTRLATAVTILLRDLASAPARARLVGRIVSAVPDVGRAVQAHLREDLDEVSSAGLLAVRSVDLGARVVTALCELAARELGEERIDKKAIPDIVRTILRAVGCPPREAAARADQAARHADAFSRRADAGAPSSGGTP
jgi:AcrR family transcriptional regulator